MIDTFYIGEFDFNRKTASTVRIINNCKSLVSNGNVNIKIIGYSDIPTIIEDGIVILNVKRGKLKISKFYYYISRPFAIIRLLSKISKKSDVIIYYGESTRMLFPLIIFSKIKKLKLIADVVEWYDYSHLPLGRFGPLAIDTYLALTKLIPKCDSVIAISSYLQNYYANKNVKTIKIPVLVDSKIKNLNSTFESNFDPLFLNLIYAGTPGQKDLLFNVINAVENLESQGFLIKLHILGSTTKEIQNRMHRNISSSIICYGQVEQEKVQDYLTKADFSVLLRPNKRYANAGFPTKFVESLNAGLPVIANYTSDIELYLKDGFNGFGLNDSSVSELISKLTYVLSMKKNLFCQLRINAKKTAIENFDFRLYSNILYEFIKI